MLIKIGFSYKRGQYKPTKGDPELQEAFKKAGKLLNIIGNTSDTVLYVQDETKILLL
ncbi:helix-turn-helix domain-containing protein [Alkaliphilus sp. B6464]|uniref:helix-turn-helix domain-containing protein n=1 Tax=Alkaliphilus sp. B6464 TaxID=2731219 RepID=UPI001BAD7AEE|nr:winged helix-turn-helix domain-containing protein [Alkaliphilus sp. B6464]QUH19959.1 winged helix-turn-helix domain-containing protein [Alkaliphilus sp. B6464]